ncbi:MAG: phenylalanine--tRNA ligase subunit beta [Thermoplasmata archaeon]
MPIITVSADELSQLSETPTKEMLKLLPKMAVEVEKYEKDDLSLEVYPDRCDMLSVEGIARALRGFNHIDKGIPTYEVKDSGIATEVELSVQDVRPYIVTAVIENTHIDQRFLKSLMNTQEKLHLTLGRGREKVAIGVHDLSKVTPPFVYKGVNPSTTSFVPLNHGKEMTLKEILKRHEKGQEYAHLLKGAERYPLIVDSKERVLSFPPVINGRLTEVTTDSKSLYIDMTGTDLKALEQSLNILCTMFAERGGEIHGTKVFYGKKEIFYPDLSPLKIDISIPEVKKLLGIELKASEIKELLARMRYEPGEVHEDFLTVLYPAYRHDIIHPWDVIEDIAMAYDYHRFSGERPQELTFGEPLPSKRREETLSELMLGYGFNEVMNFTLSSPNREFDLMERNRPDTFVKIENPVSEESSCLRVWLLPSLMKNLKDNRKNPLPQKLFEIGDVVEEYRQKTHAAAVLLGPDTGFTAMKSMIDGIIRSMGLEFSIEEKRHPSFIPGRCASVNVKREEIGVFGEMHPKVLTNFGLEYPATAFELSLYKIFK